MIGLVKWYSGTKGYGFIAPENGGNDVFVHVTDVRKSGLQDLGEGQRVSFELANAKNGKSCATRLSVL